MTEINNPEIKNPEIKNPEIKNKSEFVRGVLREIGALTDNPPKDWRQMVEDALKKQSLDMHQVMIYQIRRNAMGLGKVSKNTNGEKNGEKNVRKVKLDNRKKNVHKVKPTDVLSLDDVVNARKIAEEFGGVGKLAAALAALEKINTTLLK